VAGEEVSNLTVPPSPAGSKRATETLERQNKGGQSPLLATK